MSARSVSASSETHRVKAKHRPIHGKLKRRTHEANIDAPAAPACEAPEAPEAHEAAEASEAEGAGTCAAHALPAARSAASQENTAQAAEEPAHEKEARSAEGGDEKERTGEAVTEAAESAEATEAAEASERASATPAQTRAVALEAPPPELTQAGPSDALSRAKAKEEAKEDLPRGRRGERALSASGASAQEGGNEKAQEAQPSEKKETLEKAPPAAKSSVFGKCLRALLVLFLAAILLVGAGAGWLYWDVFKRPLEFPAAAETVDVLVEEGDSARRVVEKIRACGIGITDLQLRILGRLEPEAVGRLHIGLYRFKRGLSAKGMLDTLQGDPLIDQQVRIPDGSNVWDVKRILSAGVNLKQDAAALDEKKLLERLGLAEYGSMEGFVAPDTYRYGSGSSDLSILRQAVERQKRLLQEAWEKRSPLAAELKSPYELLILASIIEKETGVKGDRHLVSSVFHNRLKGGMPLQTDPTVIYGLGPDWKGRLTRRDLQKETPYNTYKIPALPPTPISNPTPASIEAAANPAKTDFLYFVARGDGSSEFTTNLRDHNRAVRHFLIEKKSAPFASRYAKEKARPPKPAASGRPKADAPVKAGEAEAAKAGKAGEAEKRAESAGRKE